MKLVYGGIYKSIEQLPKGDLPENAVRFIEPETPEETNKYALGYTGLALLCTIPFLLLGYLLHGAFWRFFTIPTIYLGLLCSLLAIVPHELLHAICFPKEAKVYLYFAPKQLMAFVTSPAPISKEHYIWLSLCPNLCFGWIPLAVWALFLPQLAWLFSFAMFSITMGAGDYMNVMHAMKQMPKGSIQQLSGFHSYWYTK